MIQSPWRPGRCLTIDPSFRIGHISKIMGGDTFYAGLGDILVSTPGNVDPLKWDDLIKHLRSERHIPSEEHEVHTSNSFLPSHVSGGARGHEVSKLPLEGIVVDIVQDIDRQCCQYGKVKAFRARDDTALMVTDENLGRVFR